MAQNTLIPWKDENEKELSIQVRGSDPSTTDGIPKLWFNTATNLLKHYDGSTVQTISARVEDNLPITLDGTKTTNVNLAVNSPLNRRESTTPAVTNLSIVLTSDVYNYNANITFGTRVIRNKAIRNNLVSFDPVTLSLNTSAMKLNQVYEIMITSQNLRKFYNGGSGDRSRSIVEKFDFYNDSSLQKSLFIENKALPNAMMLKIIKQSNGVSVLSANIVFDSTGRELVTGRVYAWGDNGLGQLGDNTIVDKSSPVLVVGQSDFVAISSGLSGHSLALKADGRVYAYGLNTSGQLGDNTIVNKSSPVLVVGQSDFVAIAAGGNHSLALKADGRVYAWGDNNQGQLGDNTIVNKSSPVLVVGQSDFVAIAAGYQNCYALKADGRVYAWGQGGAGQLGDNTTVDKSSPVLVVGQSDFVAISSGLLGSFYALKADGRVYAWGINASGQLGDNTNVGKSSPVLVVGQSDFVAIAGGRDHCLALKADGRVYAWGYNVSGQLGDNQVTFRSSPVLVVGQSDFVAIAAGGNHSLALKADGRVYAWGRPFEGQLGDNTTVSKSSPVLVVGQSDFVAIAAGGNHSLALKKT